MDKIIVAGSQDIFQVGVVATKLPKDLIDEPLDGLSDVARSEGHSQLLKLAEGVTMAVFIRSRAANRIGLYDLTKSIFETTSMPI